MMITRFEIPRILCDEALVNVLISLDCEHLHGCLQYIGGVHDGETVIFGSKEVVDENTFLDA